MMRNRVEMRNRIKMRNKIKTRNRIKSGVAICLFCFLMLMLFSIGDVATRDSVNGVVAFASGLPNDTDAEVVIENNEFVVVPVVKTEIVEVKKDVVVTKDVIDAPFETANLGIFTVRAFCDCETCSHGAGDFNNVEDITAVSDGSVIPYGTEVYIKGVGVRQVQPSSKKVGGNNILVYFKNHKDVEEFGTKELNVYKVIDVLK